MIGDFRILFEQILFKIKTKKALGLLG